MMSAASGSASMAGRHAAKTTMGLPFPPASALRQRSRGLSVVAEGGVGGRSWPASAARLSVGADATVA